MRAMSASQTRIADTLEVFYTADRAGEGAMAGHAYKAAVDELDTVVARDLVSLAEERRSEKESAQRKVER